MSPEEHLEQAEHYLTRAKLGIVNGNTDARVITSFAQMAESHMSVAYFKMAFGIE